MELPIYLEETEVTLKSVLVKVHRCAWNQIDSHSL